MKFASLVFLLMPFVANAADLCVEDNILKCKELGYTESSCPYGGVACQYDTSLWYCAKWTCEDGRLYSAKNKPTNADCVETAYKNLTCYDCTEGQQGEQNTSGCAIGDIFYADGSCSSVDEYDSSKTAVGVVYALSATKGGIPYTTAEAEAEGFRADHGRVINLRDLTSDTTYTFDPENPYDNTERLPFGLYETDVSGLTNYDSIAKLTTAIKNNDIEIYNGKENTVEFANTAPAYIGCTNGSVTEGTSTYNELCTPTATNASLSFYPPEVSKTHATVGAGNWYLPATGELALLYGIDINTMSSESSISGCTGTTITIVNNTLTTLESKGVETNTLTNDYYWSSAEANSNGTWEMHMSNCNRGNYKNRDMLSLVRVSLEF